LIAVSIVAQCKIMLALRAEYGHHAAAQAGLQLLFLAIATPGAVIALLFAADALVKFKRGETNFKSVASYGAIALAPVVFYLAALLWPQPESPAPVAVPIVLQHFELHEAEAYDPQTRLTWARCSVGQEYSPTGSCLGKVSMMSQWDAVRQHDGDWRVPTLDELSTLLEPFIGIDAKAFPNMDANAQFYCATQPGTGSLDDSVRMVNFVSLQIFQNGSSNYCSVRLVKRKAEPPWDVATAGKYYDAKTDLTWARCSAGQSWVAHFGCFGVVKLLTWEDAQRQADSPWRLPTKDELLTLVDKSAKGPLKINADTFPDMNRAIPAYWTGDQDEANSRPDMTMMFGVYFEQGVAGGLIPSGTLAAVRLVKSGK
jgi:hypothetical protein